MLFCSNFDYCSKTAMWFECLLFQMFLFLLAIGIPWAKKVPVHDPHAFQQL